MDPLPEIKSLDLSVEGTPVGGLSARKLDTLVPYPPRPFTSLEVEITTRCNLFCPSCPRATHRHTWIDRDMQLCTFERILPFLSNFEVVHFRGWGEPTLNPCFPEMVRLAYQSGARLVLTTNGLKPLPHDLLPYFDAIMLRLDIGRPSTWERRNPGAKFNRVIFNTARMLHQRDEWQTPVPRIMTMFIKNKYTLQELPIYLETATRMRPDLIVFYQPCFHTRKVDSLGMLPSDVAPGLLNHIDDLLSTRADAAGMDIINPPHLRFHHIGEDGDDDSTNHRCVFGLDSSLFLNWNGMLALCRYSALPVVGGSFTTFPNGQPETRRNAIFGNAADQPFEELIHSRTYRLLRLTCRSSGWNRRTRSSSKIMEKTEANAGKVVPLSKATIKSQCRWR